MTFKKQLRKFQLKGTCPTEDWICFDINKLSAFVESVRVRTIVECADMVCKDCANAILYRKLKEED
jgi:hypothetical protein